MCFKVGENDGISPSVCSASIEKVNSNRNGEDLSYIVEKILATIHLVDSK